MRPGTLANNNVWRLEDSQIQAKFAQYLYKCYIWPFNRGAKQHKVDRQDATKKVATAAK